MLTRKDAGRWAELMAAYANGRDIECRKANGTRYTVDPSNFHKYDVTYLHVKPKVVWIADDGNGACTIWPTREAAVDFCVVAPAGKYTVTKYEEATK